MDRVRQGADSQNGGILITGMDALYDAVAALAWGFPTCPSARADGEAFARVCTNTRRASYNREYSLFDEL